ncbi:integral membrane protein 2B isoform X1 [Pelobates fuscus]|uniref:integral membrane protein 2B isoform X1 n=1 Tax=Pelobates fuscus TaxID=191477 RepID=UPI002FE4F520
MVKLAFNSALAQKEAKKEDENSEVLIIPESKEPEEFVPVGQRRAWCWCMCFGLAFMLAGIVLGGAYLYKYFVQQLYSPGSPYAQLFNADYQDPSERGVYYCGMRYDDEMSLTGSYADTPVRYHSFQERIEILEEEEVELISVPVPEFADSDPADIVHDFHRKLTAYLDLNLNKCYVIPLNTSIVMPPKNFLELLVNIKAGTYLPQSYLIHEQMVVTDRIENVSHLGSFINRLCRDKETFKLQRRDTIRGIQKREAMNCRSIVHFENRFAVNTLICDE